MMGERTSAVADSRTSMPQNNWAANADAVAAGAGGYPSRDPHVPVMYERPRSQVASRNIANLLAQDLSDKQMEQMRLLLTLQSASNQSILDKSKSDLDRFESAMAYAYLSTLTSAQTTYTAPPGGNMPDLNIDITAPGAMHAAVLSALMDAEEQPAASCCACPPCNIL